MGNDGGSIPTRRELVKSGPKAPSASELKASLLEKLAYLWSTCPLSRTPLRSPIVSDSSGAIYNKDAVLRFLLPDVDDSDDAEKMNKEEVLGGRVKGLKDVVEVVFEQRKADEERKEGMEEEGRWICPVTGKVLGSSVRAVYLVPCGHAFSEEAVKETRVGNGEGEERCLQCNTPYTADNIIPILPILDSEKQRLVQRATDLAAQGLSHSLKKTKSKDKGENKKRKKDKIKSEDVQNGVGSNQTSAPQTGSNGTLDIKDQPPHLHPDPISRSKTSTPQPHSGTSTPMSSGIKNAATASLTARVLDEEAQKAKRRKIGGGNDNLKSLFTSNVEKVKDGDFMTRGFSIPTGAKR